MLSVTNGVPTFVVPSCVVFGSVANPTSPTHPVDPTPLGIGTLFVGCAGHGYGGSVLVCVRIRG